MNERLGLSGTWTYGTGNAITLPVAHYREGHLLTNTGSFQLPLPELDQIEERNGFRMRAYHRLDAGVNYHWESPRLAQTLRLGLYNAYNRKNPFFYFMDYRIQSSGFPPVPGAYKATPEVRQMSLFPVLPAVSYSVTF